jgi:uncharacterized protein (UPF0332 family)
VSGADLLARAHDELDAARLLATGGFGAQAISRAYFAAFYAAEAALLSVGETRSKHAGVIAAFGQLVVRQTSFAADDGRLLRSLFRSRRRAGPGPQMREQALRRARRPRPGSARLACRHRASTPWR